jgi:hypothetical protein
VALLPALAAIIGRTVHPRTQPAAAMALRPGAGVMAIPQESAWAGRTAEVPSYALEGPAGFVVPGDDQALDQADEQEQDDAHDRQDQHGREQVDGGELVVEASMR